MSKLILNPNSEMVINIVKAIRRNNGHCPCQVEISDSTLCPCDDFYKGECHCNLFINKELSNE